jgi:hypothetical protein
MASSHHVYRLPSTEETTAKLQQLLHFGSDDLTLNRKGRLSLSQRADILHNDVAGPIFWSMLTVLGAWALQTGKLLLEGHSVLDAVTSFFGMPAFLRAPEAGVEPIGVPYGFWLSLAPYALLLLGLYRLPWKLFLDLLMPEVLSTEGKLDIEMRGVNDHQTASDRRREWQRETGGSFGSRESFQDWDDAQSDYSLRINGIKFPASKQVILAIEEGDRYAAFFTRFQHRLVALEPLRKVGSSSG